MCLKNKTCPLNPQRHLASWTKYWTYLGPWKCWDYRQTHQLISTSAIFWDLCLRWDLLDFLKTLKGWNISIFFKISLDISRWEILTPWFLKKWTNSQFLESRDISLCEIPLFCNNSEFYLFLLKTVHCGTQRKEKGSSRKEKLFPSHVISLHIPWPQSKLINFDMYCTYWLKGWPG